MSKRPTLPPLEALTAPSLTWESDAPHSDAFGDVYFSREDGRAETEHVFVNANRLPERFAAWREPRAFVIGETGFGTGLNVLSAWACFEQHAAPEARLHLLSTEKYPMPIEALSRALNAWPSLARYAQTLCALWPAPVAGIHRLHLSERVTLDLHLGDTTERLALLDGQVDAWFLDGFAPSKNQAMWQPALFEAMAERSRPGATFATFTCAGVVKRGLKAAGFSIRKVPGFGRKREMLAGEIIEPPADHRRRLTPWFTPPTPRLARQVAVIGAGLAGACAAAALARRGVNVTVLEREAPGAGASGNRQGALYVKLAAETNDQSRFYLAGLLYSARWLGGLDGSEAFWSPCGVVQLAPNEREASRQRRFLTRHPLGEAVVRAHQGSLEALADVAGHTEHALYYPQAGWVRPATLCRALLAHPRITLEKAEVTGLEAQTSGWRLALGDNSAMEADQVVIACARQASDFTQTRTLAFQPVRGQVSALTLPDGVRAPECVVCAGGYVAPPLDGVLTFGASFVPNDATNDLREAEHQRNIDELRAALPEWVDELERASGPLTPAKLTGRAAVRAASPDKTPYAGPVPNAEAWQRDYAALSKDASRVASIPGAHHAGLWVSAAHGSRGLASAPLCAEVIASRMLDEPLPVEGAIADHLHPGRRLISALIRAESAKPRG
ncbi:bifunctional tRNA (5-methylaminomethyl-2-thiouridine)(34)-methyltransferase MnmD/FAD-dependent 5-carboxymethylaminomethyl-2-thiouridine(34) oxidoreductase MnmC [Halomonas sp. HNIBRBA4712]|uniref:bifunctional tRNA (5-methylaminomethyl-2-thiouridine)(34)-methyltransferase MnmD/FAD-dependent 5-carboxymethylaminomethyl-2-thiouridine(34) oxidoreductase MnmC n=1 Tax=Halomonas sp. HNIBRBA4712 TaxID=3373087 RepID=UPI0037451AE1